jgi:hypothetical protein
MDSFEEKYKVKEDEKTTSVHKSRRMFCIYQDKLVIAQANLPYSHAEWFEKNGWMTKEDDGLINEITRGIVDSCGDIYFYVGYDFNINKDIESIFFSKLEELIEGLNLNPDSRIFGGAKRHEEKGKAWPSRKQYGKIRDYLI